MHTNTLFLKTRASWGLGSNYNFLMICGRKRDWICINYVLFICFRNFNEFKGKIIHLNKKPLLSLNCVPPVVTSGSLGWPYSIWDSEKAPKEIVMSSSHYWFMSTFVLYLSFARCLDVINIRDFWRSVWLTNLKKQKWERLSHPIQIKESNLELYLELFLDSV